MVGGNPLGTVGVDYGLSLGILPTGLRERILILKATWYRCAASPGVLPTMRRWLQRVRSLTACHLRRRWRLQVLARMLPGATPGVLAEQSERMLLRTTPSVLADGERRCLVCDVVASRLRPAPQFEDRRVGGNITKAAVLVGFINLAQFFGHVASCARCAVGLAAW